MDKQLFLPAADAQLGTPSASRFQIPAAPLSGYLISHRLGYRPANMNPASIWSLSGSVVEKQTDLFPAEW